MQEIKGKRGLVLSESTFASSGKVSGTWLTTSFNQSVADMVKQSIVSTFEHNMFGVTTVKIVIHKNINE